MGEDIVKAMSDADVEQGVEPGHEATAEQCIELVQGAAAEEESSRQFKDQSVAEAAESLGALKDSIKQGLDLHGLKKRLAEVENILKVSRQAYEDNCDILENHGQITGELEAIVAANGEIVEANERAMERIDADVASLEQQLEATKNENAQKLQPESDELYYKNSELSNANGVVKACKKTLGAFDFMRNEDKLTEVQAAKLKRDRADLELAEQKLAAAKASQKAAQKAYDTKAESLRRNETAIEDELRRRRKERAKLENENKALAEKISEAQKRIAHCDEVFANPAATEELKASIEEASAAIAQLEEQIEAGTQQLDQVKKKSHIGIFIVVLVIIVIAVAVFVALNVL